MSLVSVNPATGETLETFEPLGADEVRRAVERAERSFREWRLAPFAERAERMQRAADLLRAEKAEHAERITVEMGKPIRQAEGEVEKCAWACEFYAKNAEHQLAPEAIDTDAERSYVRCDPLGPVLAIMPWNFPYWQVFRFAAPNLMAGNAGLLKHSSNVCRCAKAIEDLFRRAGLPEGLFQSLLMESRHVGAVIEHPAVRAVTLTGSSQAGAAVAEQAGRALKKTVLELGGSDPFIVLDDVDVEAVARQATQARVVNSGQSCIAAKRFLVMQGILEPFTEAFREALEALRVGDPLDPETEVGPLAREDLREDLESLVEASRRQGAKVRTGGERIERAGYFYAPTLLTHLRADMPAVREETFGPVAALLPVESPEHAAGVANASEYGLGASVWSGSAERAEALASEIEAGHVSVNGVVKSDPRLPFGGVKRSGYGRELSHHGIREFVNQKTVWVGPSR